ncbi:DUF5107 domain-containing protein [Glaciihabitans sp. INWT7]|nr:DUF5107 domain-containing protein [Glaciihabitans sp. INWT7]
MPDFGPPDSLPMVGPPLETPYSISGDIPPEIVEGSLYGNPPTLYPYQEQGGYGRDLVDTPVMTVVLENDLLRAVFLPEWGGRLWELFDKVSGKHLLHSPDTIQLANLGLRNAWFAGGIEWNIGTRGHSPGTASPIHTAIIRTPEGQELLRLWEFDRLRQVVFQVDAWLPENSPVLFVAVRLRNPNDRAVPMYWWTNAAIPQSEHTRVIAPADTAFASAYEGGISRVPVTAASPATDWTRPTINSRARDFFFDIPPEQRPWVVAADRQGDGLAMLSTRGLRGRKLFVWGGGAGGQRWQRWLTPRGGDYAEIQAGLAQTQFQHLQMPAGAQWSWVEAYGNGRLSPSLAQGSDWQHAVTHAHERLSRLADVAELDAAQRAARSWADLPPARILLSGSGWGALESARRSRSGQGWIDETGTPFPRESITDDQRAWLDLVEGRTTTSPAPGTSGFVTGTDWERLCADGGDDAASCFHRATMRHAAGDRAAAASLYRQSLAFSPDASAERGLAILGMTGDDPRERAEALAHYRRACALDASNGALIVEAATAAIALGEPTVALEILALPGVRGGQRSGRLLLLEARALALAGDTAGAAALVRRDIVVADLREGENAMAELWREVIPDEPTPGFYEFSMTEDTPSPASQSSVAARWRRLTHGRGVNSGWRMTSFMSIP